MSTIQREIMFFLGALLLVLANWILLGKALFLKLCAVYILLRVLWSYRVDVAVFFRRFSPIARIRNVFTPKAAA